MEGTKGPRRPQLTSRPESVNQPEPKRAVIVGQVVEMNEAYARELPVPPTLLYVVLATSMVASMIGVLLATVLRSKSTNAAGRGMKELRKGPEFLVTPIWVRDGNGRRMELEVHGHFSTGGLITGDRVRIATRASRRRGFPPVAWQIENYTTHRRLRPRRPTLWTHFGTPLLIQAAFGVLLAALFAACVLGAFR